MLATLNALIVFASEAGGIPASDWRAKIAVPLGILIFVGSVYLLVRANLGTRRGYLVLGTSLWGFMVIYALFWTFGAPGTPPATGPQNLPGQDLDAYEPVWRPFAGDSNLANDPTYDVVKSFPEGFSEPPPELAGEVATGVSEIQNFFSDSALLNPTPVGATWKPVEGSARYAVAENDYPIIGVTYQETYQIGEPADNAPPDAEPPLTVGGEKAANDGSNVAPEGAQVGDIAEGGDTYTAFGFFDAGSPLFPSLLMLGIVTALFVLHALLLARDERIERREREGGVVAKERERVPTGA